MFEWLGSVPSLTAVFLLLVLSIYRTLRRDKRALPGPWGFPIVGHLPLLGSKPWEVFLKWKNKYGGVFTISLAGQRTIVVSELSTMMEINSIDAALGCQNLEFIEKNAEIRGGAGVIMAEGDAWREVREFVVKNLTEFGTRERKVDDEIVAECQRLVTDLEEIKGRPVPLNKLFQQYALNAVMRAVASQSFTSTEIDPVLLALKAGLVFETPVDYLAMFFPNVFEKFTSVLDWRFNAVRNVRKLFDFKIRKHLNTRTAGHPRDMIDKFQDVVEATTNCESSFHPSKEQLIPVVMDIVFGAIDTTAITLQWFIMYLLKHPNALAKIQDEIDTVVGTNRQPMRTDKQNMPFTEAAILETMRLRPGAPYSLPKRTMADITFRQKLIPNDTLILHNIHGIHHDPMVWEEPEKFIPERFLTSDGCVDPAMKKKLCNFSVGKRQCPGQKFANDTLFMITTNLLQKFDIFTKDSFNFEATLGILARPAKTINVSFRTRGL